jgi:hypothetical protein
VRATPPLAAAAQVAFHNWMSSDVQRKFALILILIALPAEAHDWYPKECCEENHCHPIDCTEIRTAGTSSYFWRGYLFPKTLVSPSLDGNCHVCIIPRAYGRNELRCMFLGGQS